MDAKQIFRFLDDIEARRKGIRIWFVVVLGWSIVRSIAVSHVFQKYGLNAKVYFAIDFLSSIPYAYATAQSLLTFIDKKRAQTFWWGTVAVMTFYAPDVYIVYISKEVPTTTYIGFGLVLVVLSIFAIAQWRDSKSKKDAY